MISSDGEVSGVRCDEEINREPANTSDQATMTKPA